MSQYNPYSSAYSPQYIGTSHHGHSHTLTPWNDSPEPFPGSPGADALESIDDQLFVAFEESDQFFDSLPRLASPRPPREPLPLRRSTSRQQTHQQPINTPSYRLSSSPDPFDPFFAQGPLDRLEPSQAGATPRGTTESSVVDLTESSPANNNNNSTTSAMAPRKRKADTPGEGRSSKAPRASASRRSVSTPAAPPKVESPEMVDLVDIEDDEQYEDFKAKQQAELIKQQQLDEANKPAKLAEFQCIICMDNPTDLTVTHCGHLFCSECLHQALYAGNAKKSCPVCRTAISTTLQGKEKRQPKNGVFVLEMKLMTKKKRKRPT